MQIFTIACLITILWLCFGYSLSLGPALPRPYAKSSPIYGDASRFWLRGLHLMSYHQLAPTIPEALYCAYQLTFAIITPAIIVGSFADRMRYEPMLIFAVAWHLTVYCPIAHSCWHPEGFLVKEGDLDFAGGNVVHISSGVSGLVSAIVLGKRQGFGKEVFEPHNIMFSIVGVCMLWVGWYGFNAGSAVQANFRAAMALLVTQISTSVSAMSWLATEWLITGVPKLTAVGNGAIAGLVAITPASGYVDPTGAFFIGLLAGPVCFAGAKLKHYLGYDDALDSFGVHAVGGLYGGFMTGLFATDQIGGPGINGLFYTNTKDGGHQLGIQVYAMVVVAGWSAFMTLVILLILDWTIGLRVSAYHEHHGLDESLHSEKVTTTHDERPALDTTKDVQEESGEDQLIVQC